MKQVIAVLHAFMLDEDGATMLEYALLVALVSVIVSVSLVTLGTTVKTKSSAVSSCLATNPTC